MLRELQRMRRANSIRHRHPPVDCEEPSVGCLEVHVVSAESARSPCRLPRSSGHEGFAYGRTGFARVLDQTPTVDIAQRFAMIDVAPGALSNRMVTVGLRHIESHHFGPVKPRPQPA